MDSTVVSQNPVVPLQPVGPSGEPRISSMSWQYVLIAIMFVVIFVLGGALVYVLFFSENGGGGDQIVGTCTYNSLVYHEGDSFPATDGCNTCSCSDGEVVCTLMACEV
jgi:hypothetical protein